MLGNQLLLKSGYILFDRGAALLKRRMRKARMRAERVQESGGRKNQGPGKLMFLDYTKAFQFVTKIRFNLQINFFLVH